MLQQWTTLNARPPPQDPHKETPEQLEQRLRTHYESALGYCHDDPSHAAELLSDLALELAPPAKRPRTSQPLWQRRLRHAANRNLAAAHDALQQPLRAAAAYAAALDDDPSDFLVWIRAGRSAAQSGSLHVARRAYETALAMKPAHALGAPPHAAVLRAIGDSDEDLGHTVSARMQTLAEDFIQERGVFFQQEVERHAQNPPPEGLVLKELSWAGLVDVLRACLRRRLNFCGEGVDYAVGHPVTFDSPSAPKVRAPASGQSSDDVELVMDSAIVSNQEDEAIEVISDSSVGHSTPSLQEITLRPEPSASCGQDAPVPAEAGFIGPLQLTHERNLSPPNNPSEAPYTPVPAASNDLSSVEKAKPSIDRERTCAEVETATGDGTTAPQEKGSQGKDLTTRNGVSGKDPMQVEKTGVEDPKKPEVRRSARARAAAEHTAEDRRQTRTSTGIQDTTSLDADLIQTMLDMCTDDVFDKKNTSSDNENHGSVNAEDRKTSAGVRGSRDMQKASQWTATVSENTEADLVRKCVEDFTHMNSGPADLLLRVLRILCDIKVTQYSATLALLWSTVRDTLQLHMPGGADTSALVAEAMIASGRKAGKVKAQRFSEAGRILSHVKLPDAMDQDTRFLEIRLSWCWTILHECRGEMQRSFAGTEHTLKLLQNVRLDPDTRIPEAIGPELAGYTYAAVQNFVKERLVRLKSARDLEKAEQELQQAGKGDVDAAKRTIIILAASVRSAVRSLKLDCWDENDLKTTFEDPGELEQWEALLDAEVELEPRLRVFGYACARASDTVGELICFSIRLRMAVRYYTATVREELEKDSLNTKSKDSSERRVADLLVQIRKFVAVIKKVAAPSSSALWNNVVGMTGWSMENALKIASVTLASLTKLIITKIPILKFASANELGASQKNRRLGFTRCMLAFARCIQVKFKCHQAPKLDEHCDLEESEESINIRKMLFTTSFCIRSLVARGCCREEGTSGALIKLYVKFLYARLEMIAAVRQREGLAKDMTITKNIEKESGTAEITASDKGGDRDSNQESVSSSLPEGFDDNTPIPEIDVSYRWTNVRILRLELAQCYECLYLVPDIETTTLTENVHTTRWLEEGCRISKQIGLSFITGDAVPSTPTIDIDVCLNIYFFYRKRIFELFCQHRREGGRVKRLREVLTRLTEALPEDAPKGAPMLPFHALDTIVSEVVDAQEDISKQAAENVSRLEEEWVRERQSRQTEVPFSLTRTAEVIQLSILYFEVFSLHALSILSAHDSEYKRQKSAERRKQPKEVVDRVLTASSECLIALRNRPWSVGAWVLLGRIFIEIADVALDERELNLSTFGISRNESLQSLGAGESIETIFGRAEACFGFAESLLRHSWANKACNEVATVDSVTVLGSAIEDGYDDDWKGFGDDGDLFGLFGMTNKTTSRPRLTHEYHPGQDGKISDSRRLAAIRFGSCALSILRMREERYFHLHWALDSLELKLITHPRNRFPDSVVDRSVLSLGQLLEAQKLYGMTLRQSQASSAGNGEQQTQLNLSAIAEESQRVPKWRQRHCGIEKLKWYYSLLEAKLLRKIGKRPGEYLPVLQRAVEENKSARGRNKQPADLEPLYQLHVARMKILRVAEDHAAALEVLDLLEKFSFSRHNPLSVEDFPEKDLEDWIAERKTAIAEDILAAMHFCSSRKSEVSYAEFYFKPAFCKAVLLAEVLKDPNAALEELGKCFRLDAAIKSLDQGQDASHRGFFYKIWNYRFTDSGLEPALETERKLLRWRSKLLGLYGQLLKQVGDWRSLAAIIYRLKKRNAEDLPVDGALLDDLIGAYAMTSRASILTSMEKSIVTDVSAFESSYRRTWSIFEESLRLSQGVRRVRIGLNRGEKSETGAERLGRSGRPRCLVSIHTVLRLEQVRWKSALDGTSINLLEMKELPTEGSLQRLSQDIRMSYANTLQVSAGKWQLDEKMMKLLVKRISELTAVAT